MFEISKRFTFSAGHRLSGLPGGHKCGRVHGHNYVVELRVAAPRLDGPGWVADYGDLAPFGRYLEKALDHQWLGACALAEADGTKILPVVPFNPTAENLAAHLREWAMADGNVPVLRGGLAGMLRPLDVSVGVSETGKTWAWAR